MQHMIMIGAPVSADGKTLGKVERIIVQQGVANQFTVDPGLFGTERVVPLSDVSAATADGIELRISDEEWKAYPAYNIEDLLPPDLGAQPDLDTLTPQNPSAAAYAPDLAISDASISAPPNADDIVATEHSAVLTSKTNVVANGSQQTLHGLVLHTGRPVQVLVEGGPAIPLTTVRSFTAEQIAI